MKIIFLDIDGVLNKSDKDSIDQELLSILKTIIKETNAKIVLSSTRRLYKDSKAIVKKTLGKKDIKILSCTPKVGDSKNRSLEIKEWLKKHSNIKNYAIIDNRKDAGFYMQDNFFKTDPKVGLTYEIAEKIVDHLS